MSALLLATWLTVVIDQIDADVALLEWAPHVFGTVPCESLPSDVSEGDTLQIRVRKRDLTVTDAKHGQVLLSARVTRTRAVSQPTPAAHRPSSGEDPNVH